METGKAAKPVGVVCQLWRYPVSSLMGETMPRAHITKDGVAGDRVGAFFDAHTHAIASPPTPRKWAVAPQMAARTSSTGTFEVTTDGVCWHPIDDPALGERVSGLFGSQMAFRRYGDYSGDVLFKQRYAWKPIHIISTQSLAALQKHLSGKPADIRRFRPNIVADLPGLSDERPENDLIGREFTIAGVRLRGLGPSGRCAFTTLAQRGLPEDRSVLRALIANFEKDFGIYCEVLSEGEITEGDVISMDCAEAEGGSRAEKPSAARPAVRRKAAGEAGTTASGPRVPIGLVNDFPPDEIRRVEVAGAGALAVVHSDGKYYAVSDRCPHAGASMSEGFVENGRIVCPLHFAEFDLGTGEAFNAPSGCRHLKCYAVEREGDTLSIQL